MKYKYVCAIVLLILCSFAVYATDSCFREACSGQKSTAQTGKNILYSGDLNNRLPNMTYSKCILPPSVYTPLATDFNNDNLPDIIVTESSLIEVYDTFCNLVSSFSIVPTSQPQVVNFNSNSQQDIVVMTNTTINLYEYILADHNFSRLATLNYYTPMGNKSMDYLACSRNFDSNGYAHCIAARKNDNFLMRINYYPGNNTFSVANITSGLSASTYNFGVQQGLGTIQDTTVICGLNYLGLGTQMSCDAIDIVTGSRLYTTGNIISASGNINGINSIRALPAGTGSTYRWIVDLEYSKVGGAGHSYQILSNTLTVVSNLTYGVNAFTENATSNVMVGDYNFDGQNEICYLQNNSNNSQIFFRCLDSALNNIVNVNYTGVISTINKHYVMSMFNKSASTMGFADESGIYYNGQKTVSYTTGSTLQQSSGMIVQYPNSGGNIFSFYGTGNTYVVFDSVVTQTCGNGVCESFESAFSCAVDCGIQNNGTCLSDSDCAQPYGSCLGGYCVAGLNSSLRCVNSANCPYYAPFCWQNYCVQGFATTPPVLSGESNKDKDRTAIGNLFDLVFGMSFLAKIVFVSLLCILFMSMGIIVIMAFSSIFRVQLPAMIYSGAGLIGFLFGAAISALVDSRFIWLDVVIIVGGAGIGILYFMLKPGQN